MTPDQDAIAREAVDRALGFTAALTLARCRTAPTPERQAAAAKAMMCLTMFEREAEKLKQAMPRSFEEGVAMAKDLQEVSGR